MKKAYLLSRAMCALAVRAAALFCLTAAAAFGQGVPLQGGPWAPGHVPQYVGQGGSQPVIMDGGTAGGGGVGANVSELGIVARGNGAAPYAGQGTGPFGANVCDYDAPTTNPTGYHFLCFSPNAKQGGLTGGLITYGAAGGAQALPLQFCANGVCLNPEAPPKATNSSPGSAQCDSVTTNCVNGVITAIGAATNAVDAGGATNISNGSVPGGVLTNNAGKVGNSLVANAMLAPMPGNTVKCNPTGSTVNPQDCTMRSIAPLSAVGTFGAVPDGATDNAAAFTAIFADTSADTIYFPPGTYRLSCSHSYVAASAVSLVGGSGATIKLDAGCPFAADLFHWDGKSNVVIRDLTIDLNTPAASGAPWSVIALVAFAGNAKNAYVHNLKIINGTSPMFLVAAAASNGFTYSNVEISSNYLALANAAPTQNQCIALTTVNGVGFIPSAKVNGNICVNTAIQVDGAYTEVVGNDVSGFQFGTAIFAAFDTGTVTNPSNHDCLIANNTMHDAPIGVDVNNTAAGGLENSCYKSLVIGNKSYNLGGAGFFNFASGATYVGNVAYNNGKNGTGGAGGILDVSGFAMEDNGSGNAVYQAKNVTLIGNQAYDDGTGTQKYGYNEEPSHTFSSTLRGNAFSGVTQAQLIQPSMSMNADVGYISEQSFLVSPAANFSFTGLDTASYHSWTLSCRDLTPLAASPVGIQVGEGPTPTWETAANYFYSQIDTTSSTSNVTATGTATSILMGLSNWDGTQGFPGSFTIKFGDLSRSVDNKLGYFTGNYFKSGTGGGLMMGSGAWGGDNNAITGIRVIATSGTTIYGSCTLEGRP